MLTRALNPNLAILALTACFAPADARTETPLAPQPVAEIVSFRLIPGITEAEFLTAARATGPAVARQPGFLRRSLSRDENGLWTDYVEWTDLAAAQSAAQTVMALPDFAPFGAAIDPQGLVMRHAQIAWSMGD